ncbi:hypothetical protein M434DRAFT_400989 [Hypoxylon sp. CO27-5]|nr:hypothetical protein M434DRAFT_400989 [Hypoxylon sp. CO27-5]
MYSTFITSYLTGHKEVLKAGGKYIQCCHCCNPYTTYISGHKCLKKWLHIYIAKYLPTLSRCGKPRYLKVTAKAFRSPSESLY